jgi:transposase-like protein
LDEVALTTDGVTQWLWRVVGKPEWLSDVLVQGHRDKEAAATADAPTLGLMALDPAAG